jgi:antitoxin (DNA-binding transcriptional repressor) of toxin-antitoxin stability system
MFCSELSDLNLGPFQLHFSYDDESAQITLTKKGEPVVKLIVTHNNTIHILKKDFMPINYSFEDAFDLYLTLIRNLARNLKDVSVAEMYCVTLNNAAIRKILS